MANQKEQVLAVQKLLVDAQAYIDAQENIRVSFGFDHLPRWDLDQGTQEIVFGDKDGVAKVKARFQVAGSFSNESSSWLWAWANSDIEPQVARESQAVKAYGEEHEIPALVTGRIDLSTEERAWGYASVAAYLTKAPLMMKVSTVPGKNYGWVYLLLWDIENI